MTAAGTAGTAGTPSGGTGAQSGRYDIIIIGAGHNALVTAAYLARAGYRVLVLERREVIGGACVSEEIWPGYKVSSASLIWRNTDSRCCRGTRPRFRRFPMGAISCSGRTRT
jgi:flavin-dependent dehydrogenase